MPATRFRAAVAFVRGPSFALVAAVTALAAGALAYIFPAFRPAAPIVWGMGLVVSGLPVVFGTLAGAWRGRLAADLVATLAIVTAFLLGQPFVGLVVVTMQTGGETLERRARRRASDATRELEESAPRIAHRYTDQQLDDIPVSDIRVDDMLLVRPGELLPCDGVIADGHSHLDTSRLTGEAMPVSVSRGSPVRSGSINLEGALTLRATALARDSEYEQIVELVRTAHEHKAPIQRLADRYAIWFTPATILVAAVAYSLSGDWTRVLAVLVVATPCPLILATPVAIIGGINRAARRGIVVRHGTALEQLGSTDVLVLDKTGTITIGRPAVSGIAPTAAFTSDSVLRLAAAVEQASSHGLARSTVAAARTRGLRLPHVSDAHEIPGRGVTGEVEGKVVTVGARSFVEALHPSTRPGFSALPAEQSGSARAYVAVAAEAAGFIEFADALRMDFAQMSAELRLLDIVRVTLLSGDSAEKTRQMARLAGITDAHGDLLPGDKALLVSNMLAMGDKVLMVGDGTNDAPALASATVGAALATHGGGIAAAAADVVILADDLTRVPEAIRISRDTMRIARQGLAIGLGLSAVGMLFAAAGLLQPIGGALLQEAIDLVVIANALRAAGGKQRSLPSATGFPLRDRVALGNVGKTRLLTYGFPDKKSDTGRQIAAPIPRTLAATHDSAQSTGRAPC